MKKLLLSFLFITLYINSAFAEIVKYVYDGDTFVTTDNKKVRLLNINTPETAKKNKPSEPYANAAKNYLKKLIINKKVILKYDEEKKDKYKRHLAYVYLEDGTFINKKMIEEGLAHLYTFPKNVDRYEELLAAEKLARKKYRGIWESHPRWQVQDANSIKPVEYFRFGKYQTFKGTVKDVAKVGNKIFLNFGTNWRTDFSVEIHQKNFKYFTKAGITDIENYYKDKKMYIRGVLVPVNGALIKATHPQQLEIIYPKPVSKNGIKS